MRFVFYFCGHRENTKVNILSVNGAPKKTLSPVLLQRGLCSRSSGTGDSTLNPVLFAFSVKLNFNSLLCFFTQMLLNFQLNHYPANPNVDPRFYLVSHCFVKFHNVLTFIDYTNVATCIKKMKSRAPVSYVLICLVLLTSLSKFYCVFQKAMRIFFGLLITLRF